MEMINVVGVQFRVAGKIYDFSSGELNLRVGDSVVVETDRGPSLAEVCRIKYVYKNLYKEDKLKPIVRKASQKDMLSEGKLTSEQVEKVSKEKIAELNLKMRLLKAEVQFGGNKAIIYFTAPGRVDFRELVKRLAGSLKTRVELKQVGARDETKLLGGVGICGRAYCCSTFLREFVPVSIKMAKNQNLALNPSKVSGGCGRLLCCLTYEDETYSELRQKMLPKGTRVRLVDGSIGDVIKSDFLNQVCIVETTEGQQVSVAVKQLEVVERGSSTDEGDWGDDIDLEALEALDERGKPDSVLSDGEQDVAAEKSDRVDQKKSDGYYQKGRQDQYGQKDKPGDKQGDFKKQGKYYNKPQKPG